MISHPQSGYMLPDGFRVVSSVFKKIVNSRLISRHSKESECLARYALKFYMNGTRDAWELEQQLKNVCVFVNRPPQPALATTSSRLFCLSYWHGRAA